jgi:hypothetical protein
MWQFAPYHTAQCATAFNSVTSDMTFYVAKALRLLLVLILVVTEIVVAVGIWLGVAAIVVGVAAPLALFIGSVLVVLLWIPLQCLKCFQGMWKWSTKQLKDSWNDLQLQQGGSCRSSSCCAAAACCSVSTVATPLLAWLSHASEKNQKFWGRVLSSRENQQAAITLLGVLKVFGGLVVPATYAVINPAALEEDLDFTSLCSPDLLCRMMSKTDIEAVPVQHLYDCGRFVYDECDASRTKQKHNNDSVGHWQMVEEWVQYCIPQCKPRPRATPSNNSRPPIRPLPSWWKATLYIGKAMAQPSPTTDLAGTQLVWQVPNYTGSAVIQEFCTCQVRLKALDAGQGNSPCKSHAAEFELPIKGAMTRSQLSATCLTDCFEKGGVYIQCGLQLIRCHGRRYKHVWPLFMFWGSLVSVYYAAVLSLIIVHSFGFARLQLHNPVAVDGLLPKPCLKVWAAWLLTWLYIVAWTSFFLVIATMFLSSSRSGELELDPYKGGTLWAGIPLKR